MNTNDNEYTYAFKIILLGDPDVGKSSFASILANDHFPTEHFSTIGVEFVTNIVQLENGKFVKLLLWDTAGQERYRSLTRSYYNNVIGCFIFFDLTKKETFNNVKYWLDQISEKINDKSGVIYLIGNKLDLVNKRRVSNEEIINLIENYKNIETLKYFEVSIRNNKNDAVNLFKKIGEEIYSKVKNNKIKEDVKRVNEILPNEVKKNKCCFIS